VSRFGKEREREHDFWWQIDFGEWSFVLADSCLTLLSFLFAALFVCLFGQAASASQSEVAENKGAGRLGFGNLSKLRLMIARRDAESGPK